MERKKTMLEEEKVSFEEQRKNIILLSEKLYLERDKTLHEKAIYDSERETVMKIQADVDF